MMIQRNKESKLSRVQETFIYLIVCEINDVQPDSDRMKDVDYDDLYRIAKAHTLTAIVSMALSDFGLLKNCSDEMIKKWDSEKNNAIRKVMMLDAQRKYILQFMEKNNIWYMPLKGVILKDMYPKFGMRQMADNDILFDKNYRVKVRDWMVGQGFENEEFAIGNHDVYLKPPIYNYELHVSLYSSAHKQEWEEYYSNIFERLIKDDDKDCGYHFSDEDFYVYIITHAAKHFEGGGTGLRSFLDIYVYLNAKSDSMDWNYIYGELNKLSVREFEEKSRKLSECLFVENEFELSEEQEEMLNYIFNSGTYGTLKHFVEKKMKKYNSDVSKVKGRDRIKYVWGRLFPGDEYYKGYAEFAYIHKWARPFVLARRGVRCVLHDSKKIINELRIINKMGR